MSLSSVSPYAGDGVGVTGGDARARLDCGLWLGRAVQEAEKAAQARAKQPKKILHMNSSGQPKPAGVSPGVPAPSCARYMASV